MSLTSTTHLKRSPPEEARPSARRSSATHDRPSCAFMSEPVSSRSRRHRVVVTTGGPDDRARRARPEHADLRLRRHRGARLRRSRALRRLRRAGSGRLLGGVLAAAGTCRCRPARSGRSRTGSDGGRPPPTRRRAEPRSRPAAEARRDATSTKTSTAIMAYVNGLGTLGVCDEPGHQGSSCG